MNPSPPTIPALTGIRALAAFWVLLFHLKFFIIAAFPSSYGWIKILTGAGNLGVDLFFMLSGFIISYNYSTQFINFQWRVYLNYLRNRLARIYPVHLFTLLMMGLAVAIFEPGHKILYSLGPYYLVIFSLKTFVENLLLVQAWILPVTRSWNFFSWSISCEWLVYLLFPLFIFSLHKIKNIYGLLLLCIAPLIALVIITKIVIFTDIMFYGIIRVLPEFFAGCVLFYLYQRDAFISWPWEYISPSAIFIIIVGGGFSTLLHISAMHWVPLIMPLVIYGVSLQRGWLSQFLANRFMQYWGRVSYSLYMTSGVSIYLALKILHLVHYQFVSVYKLASLNILFFAIILCSSLVYYFVEIAWRTLYRPC